MKKNLIIAGAMLALSSVATFAQQVSHRTCGTVEYNKKQELADPSIAAKRSALENFTQNWENNNQSKSAAVITIPVVVHVIYNNATQNISDAQIQSQITVLNKDFRRLNADASNTPSVWQSIAADAGIEFCLASVDPNGASTTGITRTSTNVTAFSDNGDDMKFTSSGGRDAWPRDKYLNIWVCNMTGGTLGFTQLPGGPASTDGVVVGFRYFGTTGTVIAPFNKGRTATHEVGHWLNLYHTWGDDGGSCAGSDNVSDTPNQDDANYQCPSFPLTDGCSSSSPGVMFMNYMDYVDDNCMNMFTNGQKTRMLACLNGTRSAILNSNACGNIVDPPPTGDCDTLVNIFANDTLVVYIATSSGQPAGYISGTNTYGDNAKADKFTGIPTNHVITGGIIGFAVSEATNSTKKVTATVWNTSGTGGSPGAQLGAYDITIQSIDVNNFTAFTFTNPINAPTSGFYMGIQWSGLSNSDTIAVYTSTDRGSNTAWERWSDNNWYSYDDADSWGIAVSHAIFPVICPVGAVGEEEIWDGVSVFPNPTDGNVNVYLKLKTNEDVNIRVFNPVGQLVTSHNAPNTYGGTYSFDLSGRSAGLYFVEVSAGNLTRTYKVVVSH